MIELDVAIRSLVEGAAAPVDFDEVVRRGRSTTSRRLRQDRPVRPLLAGLAVVGVIALIAGVAIIRADDASSPSSEAPLGSDGHRNEVTIATGHTDGVSWTVFRSRDDSGMCYRYATAPGVEPSRGPDGRVDFPGLCTSTPNVSASEILYNAVFAGIAPLPSGGSLVFGLVRGGPKSLELAYLDGTTTTYAVTHDSIALGVPRGTTLDKISVGFGDLTVECTPMINTSSPPPDSRAPDGEFGCSPSLPVPPLVPGTAPGP